MSNFKVKNSLLNDMLDFTSRFYIEISDPTNLNYCLFF